MKIVSPFPCIHGSYNPPTCRRCVKAAKEKAAKKESRPRAEEGQYPKWMEDLI